MIVTFYSFKGGVGRSMAMANVARSFQMAGLNVVMVDWDLEAPGLETFFSVDAKTLSSWRNRVGLMDVLQLYKQDYAAIPFTDAVTDAASEQATSASYSDKRSVRTDDKAAQAKMKELAAIELMLQNTTRDAQLLRDVLPPIKFSLIDVPPPRSAPATAPMGKLRLLTAGWREGDRFATYANAVQSFNWNDFYQSYRGRAYFEWFRRSIADPELADVVLIDSRTGVTEMGGVCTRELADVVVTLAAPNRQNVDGAAQMAASFRHEKVLAERPGRPISVVIVPSRVDVSATEVKQAFEGVFREKANAFMPEALARVKGDFLNLRIPYVTKFAFQDQLSIGEDDGDSDLNKSYRAIAAYIAWLAPAESRVRALMGNVFEEVFGSDFVRQSLDYGKQFDLLWNAVPEESKAEVRQLLLRLVDVRNSASEPDRPRPIEESALGGAFAAAITHASQAGLIKVFTSPAGAHVLELAEPEFVSQRSELTKWINSDRNFFAWRQRLRVFLDDWRAKRKDPSSLLQGSALNEAVDMMERAAPNALLGDEREFITLSKTTPIPQAQIAAAPQKSPRRWIAPFVALAFAATVLTVVFNSNARTDATLTAAATKDSLLLAGRRASGDSNFTAAIDAYSAVLKIDSTSVEALTLRGEANEQSGKPADALADIQRAISLAPTNNSLKLDRARLLWANRDTAGALADLKSVPQDSIPLKGLRLQGDILLAQGRDSAALKVYDNLVSRNDVEGGELGRGQVLERLGNRDAAIRAYQTANSFGSDPSIKTFAQARLRVLKAPATAPPTRATTTPVYLQVSATVDARLAAPIDSSLRKIGLRLASDRGINYEVKPLNGSVIEIRYFRTDDEAVAQKVRGAVEGAIAVTAGMFYRAVVKYIPSRESASRAVSPAAQAVTSARPQTASIVSPTTSHIEIWLPTLAPAKY